VESQLVGGTGTEDFEHIESRDSDLDERKM